MATSPSTQIRPRSSSVNEFLKSAYFEIPANQREYRWGKEQWYKFWDDLLQTLNKEASGGVEYSRGHFLGTIVVIGQEQSLDQDRWKVIDGQQRLTTITILAESLRPYVKEIEDSKIKRSLEHVLLDCILSPGKENVPRLRLNREDDFYRNSLIEFETMEDKKKYWAENINPKSEVQNNIKNAFIFFDDSIKSYLDTLDQEVRHNAIRDLVETLTESFYLLLVRTENFWMAYRLFETLNERGLDLSQADLINNILLEHAMIGGRSEFDRVSKLWSDTIDNYENQSLKKLELPQIIQFSYTYRHSLVKKERVFDKIFDDLRSGRCDAPELAGEFNRDSTNWCAFLLGDLTRWSDVLADSQYAIVDPLWKSHCVPFIMASMDMFSSSISELEVCFILCEHYLFRQGLVCNDSVSSLQEFFGEAAAQLRSGQSLERLIELFINRSPEAVFVDRFKIFSANNMKQGFYTLWKIEKFLTCTLEFRPKNQSAAQHLEHIMPRNPSSEWNNIERLESYKLYLNMIGNNLVLQGDINQHIKNKSIQYKLNNDSQLDYSHSELKLAQEFISHFEEWAVDGQWVFQSIVSRQNYLADNYASKVWSLNLTI